MAEGNETVWRSLAHVQIPDEVADSQGVVDPYTVWWDAENDDQRMYYDWSAYTRWNNWSARLKASTQGQTDRQSDYPSLEGDFILAQLADESMALWHVCPATITPANGLRSCLKGRTRTIRHDEDCNFGSNEGVWGQLSGRALELFDQNGKPYNLSFTPDHKSVTLISDGIVLTTLDVTEVGQSVISGTDFALSSDTSPVDIVFIGEAGIAE